MHPPIFLACVQFYIVFMDTNTYSYLKSSPKVPLSLGIISIITASYLVRSGVEVTDLTGLPWV